MFCTRAMGCSTKYKARLREDKRIGRDTHFADASWIRTKKTIRRNVNSLSKFFTPPHTKCHLIGEHHKRLFELSQVMQTTENDSYALVQLLRNTQHPLLVPYRRMQELSGFSRKICYHIAKSALRNRKIHNLGRILDTGEHESVGLLTSWDCWVHRTASMGMMIVTRKNDSIGHQSYRR
jgi:hypothetical protein